MHPVSRHFATIGLRQVHYRRAGHGPPILLLHQTPASSAELLPMILHLAPRFTVLAPDMPGYGVSDSLPDAALSMDALAGNLAAFMDVLGIDVAGLYGFHTGASLATAFARRHPNRVAVAIAEGLLCLDGEERERLPLRYLEPFVPRWDGGHWAWLWSRVKDQSVFFPWYERSGAARLDIDAASPTVLYDRVRDWLRSGERYGLGYAAAMAYEPREDLRAITTPHYIVCQNGDPLAQHLLRLPPLPANFRVQTVPDRGSRDARILDIFARHRAATSAPHTVPARAIDGRVWQDYVGKSGAQLRVLRAGGPDSLPVVIQHGAHRSVRACRELLEGFADTRAVGVGDARAVGVGDARAMGVGDARAMGVAATRAVLAVELPGHGESDPPENHHGSIRYLAERLVAVLADCGIDRCDLVGIGAGAAIGAQVLDDSPRAVRSLTLIAPIDLAQQPSLRGALLDSYTTAPVDSHGGFLLKAWHEVRDHQLFFPWYERRRDCAVPETPLLDPVWLHERTVELLESGTAGVAVRRAELTYPLRERLASAAIEPCFAAALWEPRCGLVRALAGPTGIFLPLSGPMRGWAPQLPVTVGE
jgi:pimeloyl-ACP methyl ester carboxylesterase